MDLQDSLRINDALKKNAVYQKYDKQEPVASLDMKEELVIDRSNTPLELVGTHGLGPCIGLAVIGKDKIGVAHITHYTELDSLNSFANNFAGEKAEDLQIHLISTQADREKAKEVLGILMSSGNLKYAELNTGLTTSPSFAIDVKLGKVYQDVPEQLCKIANPLPDPADAIAWGKYVGGLIIREGLQPSGFYEKSKTQKEYSDNDQPKIVFESNPMYSFYGLWRDCMQSPNDAKEALKGFSDERLSRIADIIPQKGTKERQMAEAVHKLIGKNNISDIGGLQSLINDNFGTSSSETFIETLKPAFEIYSDFFAKNKDRIENNLSVINSEQKTYQKELGNLYKCFNTSSDVVCTCYLNPFPKNKVKDGISNDENVSMDYSLSRTEDANNYIGNSDILKRKSSTPFHESTHFLFNNSQLKKDIENEESYDMKSVLNQVISKFEKKGNGTASRDDIKPFAIGAINEAFAACSSALYNEKTTGKPVANDNEWYHGWKEANDLTKQMYPHFKEYVNEGKPFDGNFFQKLNASMKIDELRNVKKAQLSEETKPNTLAGLRGLEANPQTRAPYKPQALSKVDFSALRYIQDKKQNA